MRAKGVERGTVSTQVPDVLKGVSLSAYAQSWEFVSVGLCVCWGGGSAFVLFFICVFIPSPTEHAPSLQSRPGVLVCEFAK